MSELPPDLNRPPPGPGRASRSRCGSRSRAAAAGLLIAIVVAGLTVVVVAVVAATSSSPPTPRTQTLSAEDRAAPAALRRAAQAIGYTPTKQAGVGTIENQPAVATHAPLGEDLLAVGAKAPAFTLKTPAGKPVSLADFRGKAVLLEFFATWCPHCAAEAPHLAKLARTMPASKYALVSVNGSNEDAASVFAYHVYFGLPFPALVDPDPDEPAVTFPTTARGARSRRPTASATSRPST